LQDIRRAALDNCTRMLDEAMRSGTRQLWRWWTRMSTVS